MDLYAKSCANNNNNNNDSTTGSCTISNDEIEKMDDSILKANKSDNTCKLVLNQEILTTSLNIVIGVYGKSNHNLQSVLIIFLKFYKYSHSIKFSKHIIERRYTLLPIFK